MVYKDTDYVKEYRESHKKENAEYSYKYNQREDVKERKRKYQLHYRISHYKQMKKYQKQYTETHKQEMKEYKRDNSEIDLKANMNYLIKIGKLFNMKSHEYRYALHSWSKVIKKLDNYMCKNCDSTQNLHAHHIMPQILFPMLSLNIDNGITLCMKCHKEIHENELFTM